MYQATPILNIAFVLLLVSCTTNLPESAEEAEYQKFVSERESAVKLDSATRRKIPALHEQAYEESGLLNFIKNGKLKSREDMDKFYNEVITGKYSGHIAQEYLKGKFIRYVVTYFDLTHTEKPEEYEYLVRLTRELMATKDVDIQFNYDCLSACRGKMEKEEYNDMVKHAKFTVRFAMEESNKIFAQELERKNTISNEKDLRLKGAREEMAAGTIKSLESALADLDELTMR
jgi:hypothetical protein